MPISFSPSYFTAIKVYFNVGILCFDVLKNKSDCIIYFRLNYPYRSGESANIFCILNFSASTYFQYANDLTVANIMSRNMSSKSVYYYNNNNNN